MVAGTVDIIIGHCRAMDPDMTQDLDASMSPGGSTGQTDQYGLICLLFMWLLGSELRLLCLCSRCFHLSSSPSPSSSVLTYNLAGCTVRGCFRWFLGFLFLFVCFCCCLFLQFFHLFSCVFSFWREIGFSAYLCFSVGKLFPFGFLQGFRFNSLWFSVAWKWFAWIVFIYFIISFIFGQVSGLVCWELLDCDLVPDIDLGKVLPQCLSILCSLLFSPLGVDSAHFHPCICLQIFCCYSQSWFSVFVAPHLAVPSSPEVLPAVETSLHFCSRGLACQLCLWLLCGLLAVLPHIVLLCFHAV